MNVFTMLYVRRPSDGRYLKLRRSSQMAIMAGRLSSTGGKIEPGETVESAATRELMEETGLRAKTVRYRGSYTYTSTNLKNPAGTIHLLQVMDYDGIPFSETREGKLEWFTVDEFCNDPTVTPDHQELMRQIDGGDDVIAAFGRWEDGALKDWRTSAGFYDQRRDVAVAK